MSIGDLVKKLVAELGGGAEDVESHDRSWEQGSPGGTKAGSGSSKPLARSLQCPCCLGRGTMRCLCRNGIARGVGSTDTCMVCGGTATVQCSMCGGLGEFVDVFVGIGTCHNCGGIGRRTCGTCNGSGEKWGWVAERNVTCPWCDGSGMQTCTTCWGCGKSPQADPKSNIPLPPAF